MDEPTETTSYFIQLRTIWGSISVDHYDGNYVKISNRFALGGEMKDNK